MTVFGIPPGRLVLYLGALVLLVALNLGRWGGETIAPAPQPTASQGDLPDLPELAIVSDFDGFQSRSRRNLFQPATQAPPPPPPKPVTLAPPAQDHGAAALREAEGLLDSVRVIGFLSTTQGTLAVINFRGAVINASKGDMPVPGFLVSEVTINSMTLRNRELDLERTFGLEDAD